MVLVSEEKADLRLKKESKCVRAGGEGREITDFRVTKQLLSSIFLIGAEEPTGHINKMVPTLRRGVPRRKGRRYLPLQGLPPTHTPIAFIHLGL